MLTKLNFPEALQNCNASLSLGRDTIRKTNSFRVVSTSFPLSILHFYSLFVSDIFGAAWLGVERKGRILCSVISKR